MNRKTYQHAQFHIPNDSHQHMVQQGDTVRVEKIVYEVGEVFYVETVMLAWNTAADIQVGTPHLTNVRIELIVTAQRPGEKIRGFKYKPKKNQRKSWGHRQQYTWLRVLSIEEF